VASLTWCTASLAVIVAVPRVRRQDPLVTWRLALLLPGTVPLRFLGLILGLGVWVVVCSLLWPLALLLGAGTAIDLATTLLGRRVELLLEDLDRSAASRRTSDAASDPTSDPLLSRTRGAEAS
jgi:hypothetical protein